MCTGEKRNKGLMNYNDLNDQEVRELINKLKYPKNLLSFNEIHTIISSLFGKIDVDEGVIDDDDIQYILHIYRGRINHERYSIHIRFKNSHDHLVRVDINPSNRHLNPDGSIIEGNHIHIYSNRYDKKDSIAIPLENSDFPNLTHIVDVYSEFIKYTHIETEADDE